MGMSLAPLAGMRCQFCQQPISLLRRLSDPEFCSAKHREQYDQQQAALAIARLQPIARQTGGRPRPAAETTAAVAVLEPDDSRSTAALAGALPCPPRQSRSYWCFALPADPIAPPVGVMLREPPARWSQVEPGWATSVVAMWPVNQHRRPEPGAPVSPSQFFFALPASPLHPLPWVGTETPTIPAAIESLIPLSILPTWSLPHRRQDDPASHPFPLDQRLPFLSGSGRANLAAAPAVDPTPLVARRPILVSACPPAAAIAFASQGAWAWAGTVPFATGALTGEWQGYLHRMESQLILIAEQAGLCSRVPGRLIAPKIATLAWPSAAAELPFQPSGSVPGEVGTFAAPKLRWCANQPDPGPAARPLAILPGGASEAASASAPGLQWPYPPEPPVGRLPLGKLATPVAAPETAGAVPSTVGAAQPARIVSYCWPGSALVLPGLALSHRLAAPPEPVALAAPPVASEPEAVLGEAAIAWSLPLAVAGASDFGLAGAMRLLPPALHEPTAKAGGELHPYPAVPSVIVPASAGTGRTPSSTRPQTLFSLAHLFPARRDQVSRDTRLDPCAWRGKPVFPPTRLPRISLQERNATRPSALKEVRQVLQQQTIDRAKRFWKLAPADLKWLALALPLILAVWLWPKKAVSVTVPSPVGLVKTAAKSAAGGSYLEKVFQSNMNLGGFEERIASRSSIHLEEDFSAGLGLWEGEGNWARSWYYDKSGVARPGRMAIYQPSIPMEDYQLLLTAAVERRSISWMVRASNLRNYIAARLNVSGSGTNQRLSFERWTVKDGRVTRRQSLPLATTLGTATTARIRMDVVGNTFTTMLQDQVIDVFTDSSHATGGVGLFSSDADQPRIYRLELTHQHDFFGKLCSFLAPHPITKAGTIRP